MGLEHVLVYRYYTRQTSHEKGYYTKSKKGQWPPTLFLILLASKSEKDCCYAAHASQLYDQSQNQLRPLIEKMADVRAVHNSALICPVR